METSDAVAALSALAQQTRLECFKLLAARGSEGIAAGEVARLAGVPQNTMSALLATLARAGLVTAARRGRSVVYRADIESLHAVTTYLLESCCRGRPEICAPHAAGSRSVTSQAKEPVA